MDAVVDDKAMFRIHALNLTRGYRVGLANLSVIRSASTIAASVGVSMSLPRTKVEVPGCRSWFEL
jgi:hypothetical protein